MSKHPVHQPPPPNVVAELIRAGVSMTTALAMERWKAQEVLDLLRLDAANQRPVCQATGQAEPQGSGTL
ncbi:MAG: hypothetical protein NVSMB29_05430 [Candidatus Dormibacteria bacterium]